MMNVLAFIHMVQPLILNKRVFLNSYMQPGSLYREELLRISKIYANRQHVYERLIRAKRHIDRFYNETLDISDLASTAFFSKYHFLRLFKETYGTTPHKYQVTVRLQKARQLLRTGHSVQNTCFHIGFDSVPSFTSLFKKYLKRTPASYQKQAMMPLVRE